MALRMGDGSNSTLQRRRGKPIPEVIQHILGKAGKEWANDEKVRVIEWLLAEKLNGLVQHARAVLEMQYPGIYWGDRTYDLVMEKMVDVFKYVDRFDPEKGSFLHFIYVSLTRHIGRAGRRLARERQDQGNEAVQGVMDYSASQTNLGKSLEQLIGRLPEPYREALNMQLADMSMEEIAAARGITVGVVKRRVHWARHMLKAMLDEEEEIITILPEPWRSALMLQRLRGMTYEEIARQQGTTVAEVEERVKLGWQLFCLPEPYRSALVMQRYRGMPYADIARRQGITLAEVEEQIDIARQMQAWLQQEKQFDHIPESYRRALIMRCFRGRMYADIARNQGTAFDRAPIRVHLAWQLKKCLDVDKQFAHLPQGYQIMLILYDVLGVTYADLANDLHIKEQEARHMVEKARNML